MSILASGLSPPATMPSDATAAGSPKTAAAENARCSSCSDGIACLENGLCLCGLVEQDFERRDIGIPFDQRRLGAEVRNGSPIKRPDRRSDPGSVRVDEAGSARIESGEVNLGHRVTRNRRKKVVCVEAVIDGVDVDIVDIEKQFAAGTTGNRRDEIPFVHRVV